MNSPPRLSSPRPTTYGQLAFAALVGLTCVGLIFLHVRAYAGFLIDDSFIFLQFARTLLTDGTWGFYPGLQANTVTSPLTVLLLAALTPAFPGPSAAVVLDTVALSTAALFLVLLSRRVTGSALAGALASSALIFNPVIVSSSGMETSLFAVLFFAALYFGVVERWAAFAISVGLLTLARPDGGLLFVLMWPLIPTWRNRWRSLAFYVLTLAPWSLYSWIHLGSLLPESFFIKTSSLNAWGAWSFASGLELYFDRMPVEVVVTLLFAPLLLLLPSLRGLPRGRVFAVAFAFGAGHFAAYSKLHVPPFHWYYAPQILCLALFGAFALACARPRRRGGWGEKLWRAAVALALLAPGLGMLELHRRADFKLSEMPIHSNWTTPDTYRDVAEWINERAPGFTFGLRQGEVGTLAYYCDCIVLDAFSDRRQARISVRQVVEAKTWVQPLMQLNFLFYEDTNQYPPFSFLLKGDWGDPSEEPGRLVKRWRFSSRWNKESWLAIFEFAPRPPVPQPAPAPSPG